MGPSDYESCGWHWAREGGLCSSFSPMPSTALRGNRVAIFEDVVAGALGWADRKGWAAHVRPSKDYWIIQRRFAHEADHFALWNWGVPTREHHRHTEKLSIFWRVPKASVLKVVRRHTADWPVQLLESFPGMSPTEVLLRAGHALPLVVIVYSPLGRLVAAGPGCEVELERPLPFERSLVRRVRNRKMAIEFDDGVNAWPYREGEANCVVIAVEPDALAAYG